MTAVTTSRLWTRFEFSLVLFLIIAFTSLKVGSHFMDNDDMARVGQVAGDIFFGLMLFVIFYQRA